MIHLIINIIKKLFLICILLLLFVILNMVVYRFDNYVLYSWEARIRWGKTSFDSEKFQKVSTNDKAKMMYDLLRKKKFIGETPEKVKTALGKRTGSYYNDEVHLTYVVFKSERTAWDVVFIFDYETQKIGQIFVYRQQGGITRRALYVFMDIIDRLF